MLSMTSMTSKDKCEHIQIISIVHIHVWTTAIFICLSLTCFNHAGHCQGICATKKELLKVYMYIGRL
jgi:hypothetical protein